MYNPYYPPNYPMAFQQAPQPQPQPQGGLIWVQGEAGAKSYLVAPNSSVTLWDSEGQTIYLKSADATGMPSIKVLDYTIRGGEQPKEDKSLAPDMGDYATKDELHALEEKIQRRFDKLMQKKDGQRYE